MALMLWECLRGLFEDNAHLRAIGLNEEFSSTFYVIFSRLRRIVNISRPSPINSRMMAPQFLTIDWFFVLRLDLPRCFRGSVLLKGTGRCYLPLFLGTIEINLVRESFVTTPKEFVVPQESRNSKPNNRSRNKNHRHKNHNKHGCGQGGQ